MSTHLIRLTDRLSGEVCFDISLLEGGDVAFDPARAQARTEIVSNIRAGLLRERVGSEFDVEVVPGAAPSPLAPSPESPL